MSVRFREWPGKIRSVRLCGGGPFSRLIFSLLLATTRVFADTSPSENWTPPTHARGSGHRAGLSETHKALALAIKQALDDREPLGNRTNAIRILAGQELDLVAPIFAQLLAPGQSEDLSVLTLDFLNHHESPGVMTVILSQWNAMSQPLRRHALQVAFHRRERLLELLAAVGKERVQPWEIDGPSRDRLTRSSDREISTAARAMFGARLQEYERRQFELWKPALALRGDAANGKAIFDSRCASCHLAAADGTAAAPALTNATRATEEELLKKIVSPAATLVSANPGYSVETRDGHRFDGFMVKSNVTSITLRRSAAEGLTVARPNVQKLTRLRSSLMPEDLVDGLTQQEVADLLDYLKSAP